MSVISSKEIEKKLERELKEGRAGGLQSLLGFVKEKYGSVDMLREDNGYTFLHRAVAMEDYPSLESAKNAVETCLTNGADVNAGVAGSYPRAEVHEAWNTPMHVVSVHHYGNPELGAAIAAKLLELKADLDIKNRAGLNAIDYSLWQRDRILPTFFYERLRGRKIFDWRQKEYENRLPNEIAAIEHQYLPGSYWFIEFLLKSGHADKLVSSLEPHVLEKEKYLKGSEPMFQERLNALRNWMKPGSYEKSFGRDFEDKAKHFSEVALGVRGASLPPISAPLIGDRNAHLLDREDVYNTKIADPVATDAIRFAARYTRMKADVNFYNRILGKIKNQ